MPTYNFKTPSVPTEIREIRHHQYKNIYEYELGNQNLWGTETLLGDWNGEYLLIAKDFYPASYIEATIQDQEPQPYRHNPSAPTNRNLIKTLAHFGKYSSDMPNTDRGFLYTSACFLLRADGEIRGKLPDEVAVMQMSYPVLKFTVDQMSNLKQVVLMGKEAARAVEQTLLLGDITAINVRVHRVSHPSRAMTDVDRFAEWEAVFGVDAAVADTDEHNVRETSPVVTPIQGNSIMSKRDKVLEYLSVTPQSVKNLMNRTNLADRDVRGGIDALRRECCVWLDSTHGFWIDDPISQRLPPDGSGRWRRDVGTDRLD